MGAETESLAILLLDAFERAAPIRAFYGPTWNVRLSIQVPDVITVTSYGGSTIYAS